MYLCEGLPKSKTLTTVGRWRKAWHIHDWFNSNLRGGVSNLGVKRVSHKKLKALLAWCKEQMETLPSTDWSNRDDCQRTIGILEDLMSDEQWKKKWHFYSANW